MAMLLKIKGSNEIASSEITPKETYRAFQMSRRQMIAGVGATAAAAAMPQMAFGLDKLNVTPTSYTVPDRATTPQSKADSYNNYYEFGPNKDDPAKYAHTLKTRPWTVKIEGLVKTPQTIDIDKILSYRPSKPGRW
jgi:sulfoxide reductase catalytic subunit YedY